MAGVAAYSRAPAGLAHVADQQHAELLLVHGGSELANEGDQIGMAVVALTAQTHDLKALAVLGQGRGSLYATGAIRPDRPWLALLGGFYLRPWSARVVAGRLFIGGRGRGEQDNAERAYEDDRAVEQSHPCNVARGRARGDSWTAILGVDLRFVNASFSVDRLKNDY